MNNPSFLRMLRLDAHLADVSTSPLAASHS